MTSPRIFGFALAAALVAAGCEPEFKESYKLAGGKEIPAEVLNQGREAYMHYCYACHGEKGDGHGPAAPGLRPSPRDFTTGEFKFVTSLQFDKDIEEFTMTLPRDEDLKRVVKEGLHGTAMLAWDVPEPSLDAILQYIKTFSPRWKEDAPGDSIVTTDMPNTWVGKEAQAVAEGKKVYHVKAQCASCHAAYATKQEILDAAKEAGKQAPEFRNDMYQPVLKESNYHRKELDPEGKESEIKFKILPTDFLFNLVRSVKADKEGKALIDDVYRVIASGVGGTAMPTWKGNPSVKNDEIWALAYYVKQLIDLRDTSEGRKLREMLLSQPQ